jgi:hypothetical protein
MHSFPWAVASAALAPAGNLAPPLILLPLSALNAGMVVATAAAACNAGAFVIVRLLRGRQSALVLTW